jgi:Cu/Zn superoxide dismutase
MSMQHIIQHLARTRVAVVLAGLTIGLPQVREAQPGTLWHRSGQDSTVTWRATLAPPETPSSATAGTAISGSATVTRAGKQKTRAEVRLENAKPGSVHPWHVHKGMCGHDEGIVGPPKAYTPLHVGADGAAEVTVTLPFTTPTSGQYMVNVHQSASDQKTIIACGALQRS